MTRKEKSQCVRNPEQFPWPAANYKQRAAAKLVACCLWLAASGGVAAAQTLNWEGQTGIFVTPLAYTVPSSDHSLGKPVVGFHYLDAGSVLGGFFQASITAGAFQRIEFGYTRDFHQAGSTAGLSNLWDNGFNAFHGKFNLVTENAFRQAWLPAVSVGFVARNQVHNVAGVMQNKNLSNADFYVVATKTVTQVRKLPMVFSLGFRATDASLLGLAGNAPAYQGRFFGSFAFALRGPARSTLMLASEVSQQPGAVEGVPGAVIPTTLTYAIRIVPSGTFPGKHGWGEDHPKLSIDLGVAQIAGQVMPGVNLEARHQFALGISYGF